MEVKLAAKAGFCFGVRRAIELALKTAREGKQPIYSLGPLIHNPQVVQYLQDRGINVIENVNEASEGTLIIRSHGVDPSVLSEAEGLGMTVVDATCPFVRRAQQLASDLTASGYQVVVVGDRHHPEVRGIVGWTGGKAMVVENPDEARDLPVFPRVGVVAQTTQPQDNFEAVVKVLRQKMGDVAVSNTICNAVAERQKAVLELAKEVQVMVVVGGADSANTNKLTNLCRKTGTPTYQIETADQLDPRWFRNVEIAGLTAGASTPDWIIEEVEQRMREMEEMTNPEDEMQSMQVKSLRGGEIVRGVVVYVGQDEVLVDVGAKSEGVIPLRELSCCEVTSPQDIVQVGDEIDVWVVKAEDNEGRIILSKNRADAVKAWERLEQAFQNEEPVEGMVREVVKGGLLVDLGVRAFLPASQADRGFVENLAQFVGRKVRAKIIELNRSRKKVILSRKAVLETEYAEKRKRTLESIQEGDVVRGTVRRLTEFGAFVDIGGLDGLLHISEISWHRINHPSEVLNVGDEVEVKVLRVDRESEKVSLSLKQVLPNPWDTVAEKYPEGSIVKARVVRLVPFGTFVELEPGVEGLIHISHLAEWHVAKPEDVVQEGQEINVKVLSVDQESKRIRLSLREAAGREFADMPENRDEGTTIGDAVGDKLTQEE
ncbi:bifunctional 4-hydroxy-3-methylbut-2-enyl diphosphate reductase/30S ribosomal protein S1 [Desulforudis sp. 1088]|uniref:bifunctional 4-hydroxy-3-methylbut-2-enyl diphosphate reductase/30S ribosomal protein S1 n=1 Tax=unclassified Candidatus Desulforudis TaxID=2635950 RepID=UPI00348F0AEE